MDNVDRMMNLFRGYRGAYGTYIVDSSKRRRDGKAEGAAHTKREPVSRELWLHHLGGDVGIGIIPITEENECYWGTIDVDTYSLDLPKIARACADLPLVVCRSKSGGAHIFLFTREAVPASLMQNKLTEIAGYLGCGGSEIFPKQIELHSDRGDLGNWLNMPYFNAAQSTRFAYSRDGSEIDLETFIGAGEELSQTLEELEQLTVLAGPAPETPNESSFSDGPPCLQHMAARGVGRGGRNKALFNMGVYVKKKSPDNWEGELHRVNLEFIDPPLPDAELRDISKHLAKKDYQFTCNDEPLCSFCDKGACRLRPFGIGSSESSLAVTSLSKLDTEPPIWFADIPEKGRLELTTDDLNASHRFVKCCMEQLSFRPVVSPQAWSKMLTELFENLTIIEMSAEEKKEMSHEGAFESAISGFFNMRYTTGKGDISQVVLGKPVPINGVSFFRLDDVIRYAERSGFKGYTRPKFAQQLRLLGAEPVLKKVDGEPKRLWQIPNVFRESDIKTPDMESSV